ncbi:MAG: hypothetical protein RI949_1607 [Pseudomonadota bacterium]
MSSKGWGRWFRLTQVARLGTVLVALWKLMRHPQTPRSAKIVAAVVVAYAVSPVDLIPDFIPVLGQLDDLVLVPLGVALAIKLTPPDVWEHCMHEAEHRTEPLPRIVWGALLIIGLWLVVVGAFLFWLVRLIMQGL